MAPHQTLAIAMTICAAASSLATATPDNDYVALHNAARAAAGAGPVEWDREAARRAGERAAACCTSGGSGSSAAAGGGGGYGENVFRGAPGKKAWTAADAVRAWTAPAAREHAQVLSPGSTKVGCARAVCGGHGGIVISCSYQRAVKEQLRGAPLPRECRFNISRCYDCPIC